ncbi:MAG: hypothetical protein ACRDG9_14590, partial [Actinomycetota bacterium]
LAPWGERYASLNEAWADCLIAGGIRPDCDLSRAEQDRRRELLSKWRADNPGEAQRWRQAG